MAAPATSVRTNPANTMATAHAHARSSWEKMLDDAIHTNFSDDSSDAARQIKQLDMDIGELDGQHTHEMKEIRLLIKDFLEEKVIEHLRQEVEEEIALVIDALVDEEVRTYLEDRYIPSARQDELEKNTKQLEIERRRLHNLESLRANADLLSPRDDNEPLRTIYMKHGEGDVSAHFPATLGDLFRLDVKSSKALAADYELGASDSKDKNINLILLCFGVKYQRVRGA
ncbi:hypothetical protein BDZ89DRAFT_1070819 [Hymenopellis radicata]|nr:hypothetical protein BDZ89DRAFT_1070819 [Hymenopellis radicata]